MIVLVIRRLYIHNFRCFENFELPVSGLSSVLLIGSNGSGKSTIGFALEVLQKAARGTNRVGDLVTPADFAPGRAKEPMRFEIEVELQGQIYDYRIAFEFPSGFRELRVGEESLRVNDKSIYTREKAQVVLTREETEARFGIDWHLVALPIVHERSQDDPLAIFKKWLARTLILRPIPSLIGGESTSETLEPDPEVKNLGAWFAGLMAEKPAAYARVDQYLRKLMPDLNDIRNPVTGPDSRSLEVQFAAGETNVIIPFRSLSDGEKCFMIGALVLAANEAYGPLLCFWDEPDGYLTLSEVGEFVLALRSSFRSGGQFIMTSHNPEAIRRFSDENTLLLCRRSHLEPTMVRKLSEVPSSGDIVSALIRGDLDHECQLL
jgi:predicted ATPase